MFCKFLIVFGLLAAFSVQGMEATELNAHTVELRSMSDLIEQVKELIKNLNDIVSGVLGNALGTFKGVIETIKAIKEKFLNQGLNAITGAFNKGLDFLANKTEEAENLGINIAKCTAGKHEQLVELGISLAGELSNCVSEPVTSALEMVNNNLKIIGEITNNIASLPADLAKCMISLRPITCVTNMVTSLSQVVLELPGQIKGMIDEVLTFVGDLPGTLGSCANGISVTANSKVDAMIDEVSKCVDELIPKPTVRF